MAKEVFRLAECNQEYECVTASSVTDMLFVLSKAMIEANKALPEEDRKPKKTIIREANDILLQFIEILHILPVTEKDVCDTFLLEWDDTEDALQYVVARENGVDLILTSNVSDFKASSILVETPREFLEKREK